MKYKFALGLLAALVAPLSASATTFRTAVSVSGSDSNPCTPALPCRTISYALTQTSAGGEMFILSSGGYGPFTVTQAITITAPTGTLAAISAPSGDGVTVNAGATDLVILSGFLIDGLHTGNNGITVNSVGSLSLSGSQITGFTGHGLSFTPNAGSDKVNLTVSSSAFYSNGDSILMQSTGGVSGTTSSARASISNSTFSGPVRVDSTNSTGRLQAAIIDCIFRYSSDGVVATAPSSALVVVEVTRSTFTSITTALTADGANAYLGLDSSSLSSISTIANPVNSGSVRSFGNNAMFSYTTLGTLTTLALK